MLFSGFLSDTHAPRHNRCMKRPKCGTALYLCSLYLLLQQSVTYLLAVPGPGCCAACSLVVAHTLLIAAAFLTAERRLWGTGSAGAARRLSCCMARGIFFPGYGSNLHLPHWQRILTTEPPGKPPAFTFNCFLLSHDQRATS